jgi:tRNA G18 (ribose-2'-O)-methylase SpoU
MTFEPTDDGPFWMDAATREKTRKDVIVSGTQKKRKYTKEELQQMLLAKGLTMKGRLKDLQAAAQLNGIPIEEVKEKKLKDGKTKQKG